MKGIILHGGHGTRLRPLTHTGPKQLLPIANKPMSQYALEDLKSAGVTEIAIIVGDIYPDKVREYYGDGGRFGVRITYVHQEAPRGISHAIGLCRDFVGDEKFAVYLGDNVLRKDLTGYARSFQSSGADALILLCGVEDPSRFGIAELDPGDPARIKSITEKPRDPPSNLAVIGIYFLTPRIFDIIGRLKPSRRGELEITDALQMLMDGGGAVRHDTVTGWWKDTGTPEDIIHANRLVLDSIGTENQFLIDDDAEISAGDGVVIGRGTEVAEGAEVAGPAIIGRDCHIGRGARVGPYASIGDNCRIDGCRIEDSIVMNDCRISAGIDLAGSIVASHSEIRDGGNTHARQQFLIGERSRLRL